jgi:epoxide hydrolase 4
MHGILSPASLDGRKMAAVDADASAELTHRTVLCDGVNLHCVTAGPADGRLVVLLHGFPARWSTWRAQLAALGRAGFFVVAPDLRGYGESDRPVGVQHYSIGAITGDVVALIHALGRERALVAGHDFGGGVGWALAMQHPDVVERLATLASVHPVGFQRQMKRWSQIKKSWYVFFFLAPGAPEWLLSRRDFQFLKRSLADDGLAPDVVLDLLEGVRPPGALRAAIDWYRASFRDGARGAITPTHVTLPTLAVWGDRERHFDPELATPPADWVTNARVVHVPDGSHWVHHDAPEEVNAVLLAFFSA